MSLCRDSSHLHVDQSNIYFLRVARKHLRILSVPSWSFGVVQQAYLSKVFGSILSASFNSKSRCFTYEFVIVTSLA
jgi:hypothetical protein